MACFEGRRRLSPFPRKTLVFFVWQAFLKRLWICDNTGKCLHETLARANRFSKPRKRKQVNVKSSYLPCSAESIVFYLILSL